MTHEYSKFIKAVRTYMTSIGKRLIYTNTYKMSRTVKCYLEDTDVEQFTAHINELAHEHNLDNVQVRVYRRPEYNQKSWFMHSSLIVRIPR